jgi:hypothetical protein
MIRLSYTFDRVSEDTTTGERTLDSGSRVLELDAVVNVSAEQHATLTERAVEGGVGVDHKRAEQTRITVEGWVSNTPLGAPPPGGTDARISATSVQQSTTGANVLQFNAEFDRVVGVFSELRRLAREPVAITLSTPTREYEEVQLVSVSAPMNVDSGRDAMLVVLEFVEVRIAETRDTEAPVPREPRGARRANRGPQQGAEDAAENTERNESTLVSMLRGAGVSI